MVSGNMFLHKIMIFCCLNQLLHIHYLGFFHCFEKSEDRCKILAHTRHCCIGLHSMKSFSHVLYYKLCGCMGQMTLMTHVTVRLSISLFVFGHSYKEGLGFLPGIPLLDRLPMCLTPATGIWLAQSFPHLHKGEKMCRNLQNLWQGCIDGMFHLQVFWSSTFS